MTDLHRAFVTGCDQDKLRRDMAARYQTDLAALRVRDIWPPPWCNEDYTIQQNHGRLLAAIADNLDDPVYWHSKRSDICRRVANLLGMQSISNAKTTVRECLSLKYISAAYDDDAGMHRLDLTFLGRDMLDMWEDSAGASDG